MKTNRNFKHKIGTCIIIIFTIIINVLCAHNTNIKAKGTPVVVSLGDSYSSGEGVEPFYGQDKNRTKDQNWLAHRSTKSWPSMLSIKGIEGTLADNKDENWFFVATSGATTDNLKNSLNKEYNRDGHKGTGEVDSQLNIFDTLNKDNRDIKFVTMTFGGNDVGFKNLIETAVINGYINPEKLTQKLKKTWIAFYADNGIKDDIKKAYIDVSKKTGKNTHIIVAGYPKLLSESKFKLIKSKSSKMLNESVSQFNNELGKLVNSCKSQGIDIHFVSVEKDFEGHEAYSDEPYINEIIFPSKKQDLKNKLISDYSIHPNEKGVKVYAKCVQSEINRIEQLEENSIEDTESNTDSKTNPETNPIKDKINEEIDIKKKEIEKWIEDELENKINQFLYKNCRGC